MGSLHRKPGCTVVMGTKIPKSARSPHDASLEDPAQKDDLYRRLEKRLALAAFVRA